MFMHKVYRGSSVRNWKNQQNFTFHLLEINMATNKKHIDIACGKKVFPLNIYTPENKHGGPQNEGLEKVTPFKKGNCWYLSMLDFCGVMKPFESEVFKKRFILRNLLHVSSPKFVAAWC